ncbi:MAG: YggS family pyridoxal phosphate-dependent enzyme [Wenzhouxiangella sp.]|nr:MAG: YggS family pyridoxal phosphate-dependent enzyme [Wenzhouxiangella sp.]
MNRLEQVQARIRSAAEGAGRSARDIVLLAVSKKQPLERIRALIVAGQRRFGENYVDEALDKMTCLADDALEWHFIGPIQSNKTRALAESFDWVQSVDRIKVVRRLSKQRPAGMVPLNVLIQVDLDDEPQKAGCIAADIEDLAAAIDAAPNLVLRGLMAIPAPRTDPAEQTAVFARLHGLYQELAERHPSVDTLSAGMSADLEAAVAAGSTMVRVGTDLFGPRPD